MNYNGEPFTHIYEWKRCSPSSGSLGSIFWTLVVAIVALGFSLIIYFLYSGSGSESKNESKSEAFILATNDCSVRHSFVLWVVLLWNSHHFLVSLFVFVVLLFSYDFDGLSWVSPYYIYPLFCSFEVPFPCFRFGDSKYHFFCLNLCSILTAYWYTAPSEDMSKKSIYS